MCKTYLGTGWKRKNIMEKYNEWFLHEKCYSVKQESPLQF